MSDLQTIAYELEKQLRLIEQGLVDADRVITQKDETIAKQTTKIEELERQLKIAREGQRVDKQRSGAGRWM